MEHTKKIILVPHDVLQRLKDNDSKQANHTDTLSNEMTSVLEKDTLGDREKWLQYQQLLKRYLRFKEQDRAPFKVSMEEAKSQETPLKVFVQNEVLDSDPKMFKKKAKLLSQ